MNLKDYEIIKDGLKDTSEAPRDKGIFYRCTECGGVIPCNPGGNVGCSCGNIFIDMDYFQLAVNDYTKFQAIRKKAKKRRRPGQAGKN